jgi:hypothetical protein
MPLDLLLARAGEYERTHQLVLSVLFSDSALAERLGLRRPQVVHLEPERGLFDLALAHSDGGVTGVEIKTAGGVLRDQAERQRRWTKMSPGRQNVYFLLGCGEFEGVQDTPANSEQHVGAAVMRDAANAVAADAGESDAARGLARAYGKWLDNHIRFRASRLAAALREWRRLEYAVFYDRVRSALGIPASIYPVSHPGGAVHILNFDEDWIDLDDSRARGASLYWEIVDGVPTFKFGPVPQRSRGAGAVEIRDELRELIATAAAKHQVDIENTGRSGEYMSFAKAKQDIRAFVADGAVREPDLRDYLERCRRSHRDVARAWARRRVA